MKIAVISDTHLETPDARLIGLLDLWTRTADAILHCGDLTGERVWDFLNSHPGFYSVAGNMDGSGWSSSLPAKRVLEPSPGVRIAMTHGFGLDPASLNRSLVAQFPRDVRLICFGHTHRRKWESGPGGVQILNPGSLFRPKDGRPGYALLDIGPRGSLQVEWADLK
jgi:hypothetical protein